MSVEVIHRCIFYVDIGGHSFPIDQAVQFFVSFFLLLEQLVGAFKIAGLPFYFFDFCLAFSVFRLFLFEFADVILQFVLLEPCALNFVDLLLFLSDLIFEARHVLLLPFQCLLCLLLLLGHQGCLPLINRQFIVFRGLLGEPLLHLRDGPAQGGHGILEHHQLVLGDGWLGEHLLGLLQLLQSFVVLHRHPFPHDFSVLPHLVLDRVQHLFGGVVGRERFFGVRQGLLEGHQLVLR